MDTSAILRLVGSFQTRFWVAIALIIVAAVVALLRRLLLALRGAT